MPSSQIHKGLATIVHWAILFIFILGGCTPRPASKWSLAQIGHSSLLKLHSIPTYIHPFLYLSHCLHMHMLQSLLWTNFTTPGRDRVTGSNRQIKNAIEFELHGKLINNSWLCITFSDVKTFHSRSGSSIVCGRRAYIYSCLVHHVLRLCTHICVCVCVCVVKIWSDHPRSSLVSHARGSKLVRSLLLFV